MRNLRIALLTTCSLVFAVSAAAQEASKDDSMQNCPMHQQQQAKAESHHATVEKNGDQAMGFPHDKTTHHFRLTREGGTIEVTVNDATDKANIEAVRSHLSRISRLFASGDFSTPGFVHAAVPPGVTTMQLMKATIRYVYEENVSGGRVRVESADPVAVAAIHDFLRFQISEHQTGDPLTVEDTH